MQTPVIHLWSVAGEEVQCCVCGKNDFNKWGLPISCETGLIIANNSTEDWACKPACQSCWERHEQGELVGEEPSY